MITFMITCATLFYRLYLNVIIASVFIWFYVRLSRILKHYVMLCVDETVKKIGADINTT